MAVCRNAPHLFNDGVEKGLRTLLRPSDLSLLKGDSQAAPVTSLNNSTTYTIPTTNLMGAGPLDIAPGITWSSENANSVFGWTSGYGFGDNGFWDATLSIYDSNDTLLDTYTLSFVNNYGSNQGEFHGFQQNTANISSFRLQGAYIGAADLQTTMTTSVPEPDSWALALAGLGVAGWAMRRRA